jgi:hypothetical protein
VIGRRRPDGGCGDRDRDSARFVIGTKRGGICLVQMSICAMSPFWPPSYRCRFALCPPFGLYVPLLASAMSPFWPCPPFGLLTLEEDAVEAGEHGDDQAGKLGDEARQRLHGVLRWVAGLSKPHSAVRTPSWRFLPGRGSAWSSRRTRDRWTRDPCDPWLTRIGCSWPARSAQAEGAPSPNSLVAAMPR